MEGKRRHKRLKIVLAIVGAVIAVMIIAMAVCFGTYYHSVDVDEYFTDSDTVTVTETDSGRAAFFMSLRSDIERGARDDSDACHGGDARCRDPKL